MKYKINPTGHQNKYQQSFSWKSRSWKNNPLVLFFMLIVLFFTARASWGVYINEWDSRQAADEKQKKLDELQERQAYLSDQLESLSTSAGIEAKLREKFGLAHPDENVAIIVEGSGEDMGSTTSSVWQSVKDFFGGIFE